MGEVRRSNRDPDLLTITLPTRHEKGTTVLLYVYSYWRTGFSCNQEPLAVGALSLPRR